MSTGTVGASFLGEAFASPVEAARDFFRWIKVPDEQVEVWRDYRKVWEAAAFLRARPLAGTPKGTVLIAAVDSPFYEVKLMSMLAVALRLAGWRPVVLTNSPKLRWPRRYFRAFGVTDFVYWDHLDLSPAQMADCERTAGELLAQPLTFAAAKMWTCEDCWIGPQILSAVSRGALQGAPDVTDPAVVSQIRDRLPDTLRRIRFARQVLDAVRPEMMLIIEANYAKYAPITDLAVHRGVNVIQITQPNRDDALVVRRLTRATRREHPSSLARENFLRLRQEPWTEREERELGEIFAGRYGGRWFLQARNQVGAEALSREQVFQRFQLDPAKKTAVVFSHVLWDANLFYGEDLFADYGDWFVQTVRAACQNPRLNWLIKMHPANAWKRARMGTTTELSEVALIRQHIGTVPPHVRLLYPDEKVSTRSLFDMADYGVTVRGTVSVELPCFGVPTLTAGTGRCHGMGFTVDSNSVEEYLGRLARLEDLERITPEQTQWAKRHAHTVFCRRPWFMKSFRAEFQPASVRRHMIEHNLHLSATSLAELEQTGDLAKFAEWAAANANVDYFDH